MRQCRLTTTTTTLYRYVETSFNEINACPTDLTLSWWSERRRRLTFHLLVCMYAALHTQMLRKPPPQRKKKKMLQVQARKNAVTQTDGIRQADKTGRTELGLNA